MTLHRVQIQMWERACSRMRCASHRMCWLTHRVREQARTFTVFQPQIEVSGWRGPWPNQCPPPASAAQTSSPGRGRTGD
ncbi:hypothetical protein GDV60_01810 [Pseudomonas sp. DTU12.1]|nr:hypothetical protein GDV60_01810 [Pseudomonas sp. DTU12.1]